MEEGGPGGGRLVAAWLCRWLAASTGWLAGWLGQDPI
jgi:hypothetical protein